MFKGLLVCYAVVVTTFFSVAISGYWAFGNQAKGTVIMNFMPDDKPLLPTWILLMTNVFTLLQVAAVTVVRPKINLEAVDYNGKVYKLHFCNIKSLQFFFFGKNVKFIYQASQKKEHPTRIMEDSSNIETTALAST